MHLINLLVFSPINDDIYNFPCDTAHLEIKL